VKAHQNDNVTFDKLSRKLQLNCICDHLAKQRISNLAQLQQRGNYLFPLKEIRAFIKGKKPSLDASQQIRFHAHHQLARMLFLWKKILSGKGFDEVGWDSIHGALHSVLWLFQVWALKHVLGIAGTMKFLSHQDGHEPVCPSCLACEETCSHIVRCLEAGHMAAFQQSVTGVTSWMAENATHPDVKAVVTAYTLGRGWVTCATCADGYPSIIQEFAVSQDKIGFKNFMMGMVLAKLFFIQELHLRLCPPHRSPVRWAEGLVTHLLQVAHAQWIYRCLLVHNRTSSTIINLHKNELLEEIANQLSMGAENLMENDKYLLECNLSDLATTNGEQQEYWLLAIKAARMAGVICQQTAQQQRTTEL
jgi:hypothetical protein